MAQFPYYSWFPGDFAAKTHHLSTFEKGVYRQLLDCSWNTVDCSLPNDDASLARFAGIRPDQWKKMKPVIMAFWDVAGGQITNKRLLSERAICLERSARARRGAVARLASSQDPGSGAKSLKNNDPAPAPAQLKQEATQDLGSGAKSLKNNDPAPAPAQLKQETSQDLGSDAKSLKNNDPPPAPAQLKQKERDAAKPGAKTVAKMPHSTKSTTYGTTQDLGTPHTQDPGSDAKSLKNNDPPSAPAQLLIPISKRKKKPTRYGELDFKSDLMKIMNEELAQAVVDHRKGRRMPFNQYAADLFCDRLMECEDMKAAIDMMIERNWSHVSRKWVEKANRENTNRAGPKPGKFQPLKFPEEKPWQAPTEAEEQAMDEGFKKMQARLRKQKKPRAKKTTEK